MKHPRRLFAVSLLFASLVAAPTFGQEQRPAIPADYTIAVVRVKVSSAQEAARAIDEAFNGSGAAREDRVVALPVPLTRWVFLMGTVTDLRTIRELLTPL